MSFHYVFCFLYYHMYESVYENKVFFLKPLKRIFKYFFEKTGSLTFTAFLLYLSRKKTSKIQHSVFGTTISTNFRLLCLKL